MKREVAAAVVMTVSLGSQQAAEGQDVPTPGIAEVIVTARRVEESLQDVPTAITAMTANDLQREQINTGQDLQGRIPSLTIYGNGQQRNTESPTIRGVGSGLGASPAVVIYYAEVPLPAEFPGNGQGGPGKFFDLSGLQVLKGPQGTLFGRNTTGGALLLEPHMPENSFSASIAAEGTNYGGQSYEGMFNLPIVDDKLMLRAAAKFLERDGFTRDLTTGQDLDNKHFWTAHLGLTWRPTDRIENNLIGNYTDSRDNGTGTILGGFNAQGLNYGFPRTLAAALGVPLSVVPQILISLGFPPQSVTDPANLGCVYFSANAQSPNCGQDIVAAQQARGIRNSKTSLAPKDTIKTGAVIDKLKFDLTDELTLRNIASYSTFEHIFDSDGDGSIAKLQDVSTPNGVHVSDISQTTEELQLQGRSLENRLKFTVGGYYQRVRPEGEQAQQINAFWIQGPPQIWTLEQTSYGPYAQATYDLGGWSDRLQGMSLTAGLRYSKDSTSGTSVGGGNELHSARLRSKALTYTTGLDYKVGANLLYGKVSRGYKAGGFATTAAVPADYTFEPEYVTNYEIGNKSDFLIGDVPARVNGALYYSTYTDMQRSGIDSNSSTGTTGAAIFNVGRAAIYGFEFETIVDPFEGFSLAANYAYTDGKYNEYTLPNNSVNLQLDCTGTMVAQGNIADLKCMPLQAAPRHQASLTATYRLPMAPSLGAVDGSITYAWTDKQYASSYSLPQAEPGAWLESFGLLNTSVSWRSVLGSSFDLQLFGTNLTNTKYRISNSNVWNLLYYQSSIYGEPRIVGAEVSYRWGD